MVLFWYWFTHGPAGRPHRRLSDTNEFLLTSTPLPLLVRSDLGHMTHSRHLLLIFSRSIFCGRAKRPQSMFARFLEFIGSRMAAAAAADGGWTFDRRTSDWGGGLQIALPVYLTTFFEGKQICRLLWRIFTQQLINICSNMSVQICLVTLMFSLHGFFLFFFARPDLFVF